MDLMKFIDEMEALLHELRSDGLNRKMEEELNSVVLARAAQINVDGRI